MTNTSPVYDKTNAVNIKQLDLLSFDGTKRADLFAAIVSFTIQEDIHSMAVNGFMTLIDRTDLYNTFPFVGEELILIKYSIPGSDDTREGQFIVTKVSNPLLDASDKNQIIVLEFRSIESYVDASTTLETASGYNTSEAMIEEILTGHINTSKPFDNKTSTRAMRVVYPNWKPFQAIDYIKRKSIATDAEDQTPFFFFETMRDGYNFVSVKSMVDNGLSNYNEDTHSLHKHRLDDESKLKANPLTTLQGVDLVSDIDTLYQLASGEIKSSTTQINLLDKSFETIEYKASSAKTGINKKFSPNEEFSTSFVKKVESRSSAKHFSTISDFSFNDNNIDNGDIGLQFGNKVAIANALTTNALDVSVAGSIDISAGDIVHIELPSTTAAELRMLPPHERYTGYYCVEAVRQDFTQDELVTSYRVFAIGSKFNIDEKVSENYG